MAIVNNALKVIDLPIWETMQVALANSAAGSCMVNDRRGTGRYIYVLKSATSFWRYYTWTNTWQQLASPGAGTFGAGTCMVYDESLGRIWLLITSGTGAPVFRYYTIATDAWTARSVTNLPATFGTDGSLEHTDSTVHASGNDDYIYLIGNAAVTVYRYSISGDSWTTLAGLTGSAGAGGSIRWMPSWDADKLWAIRGAATTTIYQYSIAGAGAWTTVTLVPALVETATTGSFSFVRNSNKLIIQNTTTSPPRFYEIDPSTLAPTPFVTQYIIANSTAVVGAKGVWVTSNGIEYIYTWVQSSTYLLRTPLLVQ